MAPIHMDIEHEGFDLDDCVEALEARNWRRAAETLPTVTIPNGFGAASRVKPLRIRTSDRDKPVTMGSLGKLKLAVWNDIGALTTVVVRTVSRDEYDRRMARVKELAALGVPVWDYGMSD